MIDVYNRRMVYYNVMAFYRRNFRSEIAFRRRHVMDACVMTVAIYGVKIRTDDVRFTYETIYAWAVSVWYDSSTSGTDVTI